MVNNHTHLTRSVQLSTLVLENRQFHFFSSEIIISHSLNNLFQNSVETDTKHTDVWFLELLGFLPILPDTSLSEYTQKH